jgi:hypothetical protein
MAIDWDELAEKALNTAIDVIARKVGGVETAGITMTPGGGISIYSPILTLGVIGVAIIGIILILRKH